jgi:hypothetical protein
MAGHPERLECVGDYPCHELILLLARLHVEHIAAVGKRHERILTTCSWLHAAAAGGGQTSVMAVPP